LEKYYTLNVKTLSPPCNSSGKGVSHFKNTSANIMQATSDAGIKPFVPTYSENFSFNNHIKENSSQPKFAKSFFARVFAMLLFAVGFFSAKLSPATLAVCSCSRCDITLGRFNLA
jgi:hypothetical protein